MPVPSVSFCATTARSQRQQSCRHARVDGLSEYIDCPSDCVGGSVASESSPTAPIPSSTRACLTSSDCVRARTRSALAQVHMQQHVIEVPIFATAKSHRRCGRGSALVGVLIGLGRLLQLNTLVVSATGESRAFWIKQGCHLAPFCSAPVRSTLRALDRLGHISGFANSVIMAASLHDGNAADSGAASGSKGSGPSGGEPSGGTFTELLGAIARFGAQRVAGLSPRVAPAALSFVDVRERGNFWLLPDGSRKHVEYEESQRLPAVFEWVPYKRLEAFYAGADRGWGLRCSRSIVEGQFVVEVVGRCLDETEHSALEDTSYAVGFPDNVVEAKRRIGDPLRYICPKDAGSMMRLVNGTAQAYMVAVGGDSAGVVHIYAIRTHIHIHMPSAHTWCTCWARLAVHAHASPCLCLHAACHPHAIHPSRELHAASSEHLVRGPSQLICCI